MVEILSDYEMDRMREAGRLTALVLKELRKAAVPGVSTKQLDDIAMKVITEAGGTAPCLGYGEPPFPAAICTSVNEVVVHGIPSEKVILKDGDIVTCDVVAELNGFMGDAARTFLIGNVSEEKRLLVDRTREAFFEGLKRARDAPGAGCSELRQGRKRPEDPQRNGLMYRTDDQHGQATRLTRL